MKLLIEEKCTALGMRFEGKPEGSNEKLLEAVQMAWYEEWKDEYGK